MKKEVNFRGKEEWNFRGEKEGFFSGEKKGFLVGKPMVFLYAGMNIYAKQKEKMNKYPKQRLQAKQGVLLIVFKNKRGFIYCFC